MMADLRLKALSILVLALLSCCGGGNGTSDCAVLQELYRDANGEHWLIKDGWTLESSANCCGWYGVECVVMNGELRVSSLRLSYNNLIGTVPSSIASLTALRNLSLQSSGDLELTLSASWSSWTQMQRLELGSATIGVQGMFQSSWSAWLNMTALSWIGPVTGPLPDAWSAWTDMTSLSLLQTGISSTLPNSWSTWTNMEQFMVIAAALSGTFPSQWRTWTQLTEFSVQGPGIGISGSLPSDWSLWTEMTTFTVNSVSLNSTLPTEWSTWRRINDFSLDKGSLYGSLPTQWSAWEEIQSFMVSGSFHGTLPTVWSSWSAVNSVTIQSGAALHGVLPDSWSSWHRLRALSLTSPALSGTLPTSWSAWNSMETFSVIGGDLSGMLPWQWESWVNTTDIEVRGQHLHGSLPSQWSVFSSAQSVTLQSPGLSGSLAAEWATWVDLETLSLHGNFSGTLPSEWGSFSRLITFELSDSSVSGSIPTSWTAWNDIASITLERNRLNGQIPATWKELQSLNVVILNNNAFTGSLPSEWSVLPNLNVVSVDSNMLTGPLPSSWSNLTSLSSFSAQNNVINGTIPQSWSALAALSTADISYNLLEGALDLCLPRLSQLFVHHNRLTSVSPCMSSTPLVSLDLQFTEVLNYPTFLGSPGALVVLNLVNTNMSLALEDLPLSTDVVNIVLLSNNAGVTGSLAGLVSMTSSGAASAYIELDVSNTSVYGSFDNFVFEPLQWMAAFGAQYPLANLLLFDVANNEQVYGPLPMKWFQWISSQDRTFSLNVTGSTSLHTSCKVSSMSSCKELSQACADLPFDCDAVAVAYVDAHVLCQPLKWPSGVKVVGLDASYMDYRTCFCAPGFEGHPPHCTAKSTRGELIGLLTSFLLVAAVSLYFGVKQIIRWRNMTVDLRRANELLQKYAFADSGFGSHGGVGVNVDGNALLQHPRLMTEWIIPHTDLRVVRTVASGAEGRVSMCVWNRTVVAFKEYLAISEEEQGEILGETAVHMTLRHPNIVQLLGVCVDPAGLVVEWMERGSLYNIISQDPAFVKERKTAIALDIARGMLYLHSKGVVHRDLKSLNVMVDGLGTAKVGDFGTARTVARDSTMTSARGTAHWMAPEVSAGGHYTDKCDVYSFGIILWELCTLQQPFPELRFAYQIMDFVNGGGRPPIPEGCEQTGFVDLMQRCWQGDPAIRPSFDEIVDILEL